MSAPPDKHALVGQWYRKAEQDLRVAAHLLEIEDDCPVEAVCFHAQQAVEKYVKALLTDLVIAFPRVHDIGDLVERVPEAWRPQIEPIVQEKLSYYAVATRYPGESWVTREDAEAAVVAAREVRAAVVARVARAPGE